VPPGYTYVWEIVSAPAGWELVPPVDVQCVTYNAGEAGDATFRLTITDPAGCSGSCEVTFGCGPCRTTEDPALTDGARTGVPMAFALAVNSPNPVYERTSIRYAVPEQSRVSLTIHNLRGQVVAVLEDGVVRPGYHSREWSTAGGAPIASGVYFYKMEATGLATGTVFTQMQKMVVIR
jgi:hypothetical protein